MYKRRISDQTYKTKGRLFSFHPNSDLKVIIQLVLKQFKHPNANIYCIKRIAVALRQ